MLLVNYQNSAFVGIFYILVVAILWAWGGVVVKALRY
jgi:hypothetical protein